MASTTTATTATTTTTTSTTSTTTSSTTTSASGDADSRSNQRKDFIPPKAAWTKVFTSQFPPLEGSLPSVRQIIGLLPFTFRFGRYLKEERQGDRAPIIELGRFMSYPERHADQGVPLGGVGCGCIGRSWLGAFNRFDFHPGRAMTGEVLANQFSVRVKRAGGTPNALVLSAVKSAPGGVNSPLGEWGWGHLDLSKCSYHAIFPRAWYVYEEPFKGIRMTCRQVSPVIPHNYMDSAQPVGVFRWLIENTGEDDAEVSLMFTFQNGGGGTDGARTEAFAIPDSPKNIPFSPENVSAKGVTLQHVDKVPKTKLRSADLEKPRCRCCCFSLTVFLIIAFILWLAVGLPIVLLLKIVPLYAWGATLGVVVAAVLFSIVIPCGWYEIFCCGTKKREYHSAEVAFTIATDTRNHSDVTCANFTTSGSRAGSHLWKNFVESGDAIAEEEKLSVTEGHTIGAAVSQRVVVKAGSSCEVVFVLSWASPTVHFGADHKVRRYYARFYESKNDRVSSTDMAQAIATYALRDFMHWESQIDSWQSNVIDDSDVPSWYKSQLFNELYFLVSGGSVWYDDDGHSDNEHAQGEQKQSKLRLITPTSTGHKYEKVSPSNNSSDDIAESKKMTDKIIERIRTPPKLPPSESFTNINLSTKDIGHFIYLEGQEYYMYNTLDVHFYASFALAMLWPHIELSIMKDFAKTVTQELKEIRLYLAEAHIAPRKVSGFLPHDVGSPSGIPLQHVNAYNIQDITQWKDLGSKFVLQILRDYIATGDIDFLQEVWPAIKKTIENMYKWDTDDDGLIENTGFPDQTYDVWTVNGASAYTGGLWLAALTAASIIAKELGDDENAKKYGTTLLKGKKAYEKLWNSEGQYYNYDSSQSFTHDSIMADQLAGQWYARSCGCPGIITSTRARAALSTIYAHNVQSFRKGNAGAVNGMRPNKTVDNSSMQSGEVWSGTTYALSACMIQEACNPEASNLGVDTELKSKAFSTAQGIHDSVWDKWGYFFQTPEGWTINGNHRSPGYMRPLCIWAMQWGLEVQPTIGSSTAVHIGNLSLHNEEIKS